jgi:hypothetical protein
LTRWWLDFNEDLLTASIRERLVRFNNGLLDTARPVVLHVNTIAVYIQLE